MRSQETQYLVKLLNDYSYKRCKIQRDLVYSLLGLCVEGPELLADYSLPDVDFVRAIVKVSRLNLCLCSLHTMFRTTDLNRHPEPQVSARYRVKITVPAIQVYSFQGQRRIQRWCCSEFSRFSRKRRPEQSNGQFICLTKVCPTIRWHIFLERK